MFLLAYLIFWALLGYGLFCQDKTTLLYLFFASMSFGTFAIVPPGLIGGITLTTTPIIALLIIARMFLIKDGINTLVGMTASAKHSMLLFLFWVVAIFTTVFMPRFFAGDIMIIPVQLLESLSYGVPLAPSTQNFTQLTYLSISIFATFAFSVFLRAHEVRQSALKAMCIGGIVAIITGLLDFAGQFVDMSFILEAFRNSTYAEITNAQVFTGKRVVGLMPEASSYGKLCLGLLGLLYFARISIENDFYRERLAPIVIILLIIMIGLSTSSAAYVGLAIFGLVAIIEWIWRANKTKQNVFYKRGLGFQVWLLNISLITLLLLLLFVPALFDPIVGLVDSMVFKKTTTSSFEERSLWTAVSWQAFLDSYGLGVGVGSTRPSNRIVAVLSSVGIFGACMFYGFLTQLLFKKAPKNDQYGEVLMSAAKWSLVPLFVVEVLISSSADFGLLNAFRFGLILAIAYPLLKPHDESLGQLNNKLSKAVTE